MSDAATKNFTIVGKFKDNISPGLKRVDSQLKGIEKNFGKINKSLRKFKRDSEGMVRTFDKISDSQKKMSENLRRSSNDTRDFARNFGKVNAGVRSVSKEVSKLSESLSKVKKVKIEVDDSGVKKAAESVKSIGGEQQVKIRTDEAEGRIGFLGDLIANEIGGKLTNAFQEGFGRMVGLAQEAVSRASGIFREQFNMAAQDEIDDLKMAGSIQGSFNKNKIGKDVTFSDTVAMSREIGNGISEMVATSAAPTKDIMQLSKAAMDTYLPLILKEMGATKDMTGAQLAEITKQGRIQAKSMGFADSLGSMSAAEMIAKIGEMGALYNQGTGSGTFMASSVLEQAVTIGRVAQSGNNFIEQNATLKSLLEQAGFLGNGGKALMEGKSEIERLKALIDAMTRGMDPEMIDRMGMSFVGVTQAFGDIISDGNTGLLGLSTGLSEKQNAAVEKKLRQQYVNRRLRLMEEGFDLEEKYTDKSNARYKKRREEIDKEIKRLGKEESLIIKEGRISSPFQALTFYATKTINNLNGIFQVIGPIFSRMAPMFLEFSERVFGPLELAFKNIGSDARKMFQDGGTLGFKDVGSILGRVMGEIGKALGRALNINISDPRGPIGQFMDGFSESFFRAFGGRAKFQEFIGEIRGYIQNLISGLGGMLMSVVLSPEFRPILIGVLAWAFGPPVLGALLSSLMHLTFSMAASQLGSAVSKAAGSLSGIDWVGLARNAGSMARTAGKNLAQGAGNAGRGAVDLVKNIGPAAKNAILGLKNLGTGAISGVSQMFQLIRTFGIVNTIQAAYAGVTAMLTSAIAFLTSPIGLLVVAIVGLIALIAILSGGFGNMWADFRDSLQYVMPALRDLWSAITGAIGAFVGLYTQIWGGIIGGLKAVAQGAIELASRFPLLRWAMEKVGGVMDWLGNLFKVNGEGFNVVGGIMLVLAGIIFSVTSAFRGLQAGILSIRLKIAQWTRNFKEVAQISGELEGVLKAQEEAALALARQAEGVAKQGEELKEQRDKAPKVDVKVSMPSLPSPQVNMGAPSPATFSAPNFDLAPLRTIGEQQVAAVNRVDSSVKQPKAEPSGSTLNKGVAQISTDIKANQAAEQAKPGVETLLPTLTSILSSVQPMAVSLAEVQSGIKNIGPTLISTLTGIQDLQSIVDLLPTNLEEINESILANGVLITNLEPLLTTKLTEVTLAINDVTAKTVTLISAFSVMDGRLALIATSMESLRTTNVTKTEFSQGVESIVKAVKESGFSGLGGDMSALSGNEGGVTKGAGGPAPKIAAVANRRFGLTTTSGKRNGKNGSLHNIGRAIDFSNGSHHTPQMLAFHNWALKTIGGSLRELIYSGSPYWILRGSLQPNPRAGKTYNMHHNHVHVGWAEGNLKPLQEEIRKAPPGAKVGYANSSETILNQEQTKSLALALKVPTWIDKGVELPKNVSKQQNRQISQALSGKGMDNWYEGNLGPLEREIKKTPKWYGGNLRPLESAMRGAPFNQVHPGDTVSQTTENKGSSIGPIYVTIGNGWKAEDAEELSVMVASKLASAIEVRKQSTIS